MEDNKAKQKTNNTEYYIVNVGEVKVQHRMT